MYRILPIIILLLLVSSCEKEINYANDDIFPIEIEKGKFLYANNEGDIFFEIQCKSANEFIGEIAEISTEQGSTLINKKGEIIDSIFFDHMSELYDSIIFLHKDYEIFHKVNVNTAEIEETDYYLHNRLEKNLFLTLDSNHILLDYEYYISNSDGKKLSDYIPLILFYTYKENDKHRNTSINQNIGIHINPSKQLAYYYYKDGKKISDKAFNYVYSFKNNIALVEYKGKFGVIDTLGNWIIPADYDIIGTEPIDPMFGMDPLFFIISDKFFLSYTWITEIPDNKLPAKKNGKWGCLDTLGNVLIDFKFDSKRDLVISIFPDMNPDEIVDLEDYEKFIFINGKAIYEKDDKFGLVDLFGRITLECKYDVLRFTGINNPFMKTKNQYIAALNSKYFIINDKGERLSNEYDKIEDLLGMYIVTKAEKSAILNKNLEFKTEWGDYAEIIDIGDDYIISKKDGKFGAYDFKNNEIIPFIYNKKFTFNKQGLARIDKEKEFYFINKINEIILGPFKNMTNTKAADAPISCPS